MRAWVEEEPKGSGRYRVGIYRNQKTRYLRVKSQEEAEKLVSQHNQLNPKVAASLLPENSNKSKTPTVRDYYERYLAARMDTLAVKPSTKKNYISAFKNHILPEFGEMQIGAVTETQIEVFIGKLGKIGKSGLAYNTIKGILDNFSGMFAYALKKKDVLSNPVKDKSEFYTHATPQIEIQPMNQGQSERLLNAVRQRWPEYYPIFLAALHSGLRIGEVLGLKIGDFDFSEQFVTVRRTICTVGGKHETSTKSTRQRVVKFRKVDITEELVDVLKAHHAHSREWALKHGVPLPEWLFFTRSGRPVDSNKISATVLKDACLAAGIPAIRFHDLRHTYAAFVLRDTKDIVYLKEQLGHSTIQVTVDTYGHLMPGDKKPKIAFPSLRLKAVGEA